MTTDENEFKAFETWKKVREGQPHAPIVIKPSAPQHGSVAGTVVLLVLAAGLIALDDAKGGILPDNWYCDLGAGHVVMTAGVTRPGSWNIGNGCDDTVPGCARSWVNRPASSRCIHTTLWAAIRDAFNGGEKR
jgi:hypothetical protein